MGVPSGVFSHPSEGRLRVVFTGNWSVNNSDPVFSYGPFELIIRAYVGSGASRSTALMSVGVNSAVIEVPYAGGMALVPVGMEYVSHSLGGAGTVAARNLTVACHLLF